jgi:chemotaxis protein MotB
MSHKSGKPRKKHGGGHDEEHENHERWLVSYADMLTLLFVLFVVLFSMSQVDTKKFQRLADGLAEGFGSPTVAFSGKESPMEGSSGQDSAVLPLAPNVDPRLQEAVKQKASAADEKAAQDAVAAADRFKAARDAQAAVKEVKNLREVQKQITGLLRKAKLEGHVRFLIDERGLVITVVSSEVVFKGDRADLQPGGRKILDAVAPALAKLPNKIQVDGHTNQLNVPTRNYPSAWELSTARASIVVRHLTGKGVAANRLSAAGYAGTRPLIDPADPRSVTMNRRVDVVVMSGLPADQRALLPSAAGVQDHS